MTTSMVAEPAHWFTSTQGGWRQSSNQHPEKDSTLPAYSLYNRNIGLEYNLASSNNLWTGKLLALKSFSPGKSGNDLVHAGNLQYASKRWLINGAYESTGKNFTAEVGYIPRKDYIRLNPQIAYTFFPRKGTILTHGPQQKEYPVGIFRAS